MLSKSKKIIIAIYKTVKLIAIKSSLITKFLSFITKHISKMRIIDRAIITKKQDHKAIVASIETSKYNSIADIINREINQFKRDPLI